MNRLGRGCGDIGEELLVDLGPINGGKELARSGGHLGVDWGDNGVSIDPHPTELWVDLPQLGLPSLPSDLDGAVLQLRGNGLDGS